MEKKMDNLEKDDLGVDYEAFLSIDDICELSDYEQKGRIVTYILDTDTNAPATRMVNTTSDFSAAVLGLRLGLKKLNGVDINKDNFNSELEKLDEDTILKLYAEIRLKSIKKK